LKERKIKMAKHLIPTLNRVLVEKALPPTKTTAGIFFFFFLQQKIFFFRIGEWGDWYKKKKKITA
jgi:hypothetical protein